MPIINGKIRVSEIKNLKTPDAARYSINYGVSKSAERQRQNSHIIISALKMQSDMLLYIDNLMFNSISKQGEACALSFIKFLDSEGLDYRYRKSSETSNQSFWDKIISSGGRTSHKIYCFIPDDVWRNPNLIFALPFHGVKYYICSGGADKEKLLDDAYAGFISQEETKSLFKLSVFDCCSYGQMGISTDSLSLEQLKNTLEV
ncbi:hypothetical protein DFR58_12138 [Anaerobacterium chartisolvens]|uniref:Uncharacterized protein n=1 Tax=Anaerobacterium chartisolvens TaxID=1297424 RepID=A0A369AYK7_9FIRM|nr:hypothetical protein [Anaerobacterium chartisolvens]RCX12534.1 hypothetical protein DFR58_12138 [Anaerobacterium chartisolvens]